LERMQKIYKLMRKELLN